MLNESKSSGWIRNGALWAYQRPPTREERLAESARKKKELRNMWREKMGETVCPECDSDNYSETLMGWWPNEEHYHDPNRKSCMDCGHQWYLTCPTCGQNGGL